MLKIDNRLTTGNLLQIVTIITVFAAGYAKFESRITAVETNVNWLTRTVADKYQVPPPLTQNK